MEPEIIICAAVRAKDGKVVRGHRHSDAIQTIYGMPDYRGEYINDQGFITSKNRYVDRQEAYRIFVASGAKSVDEEQHPMASRNELFSEDLY